MLLLDVSVCIFAIREDSCPNHATYRTWLTRLLTGDGEQTQNRPTRPQNGRFCVCSRHYSQVSWVVVVRKASRSSRQCAGVVFSGSMPV